LAALTLAASAAVPPASAGEQIFRSGFSGNLLELHGQVGTRTVLPDARVVAIVGGAPIEVTADAEGRFEVLVEGTDDAIVELLAYGQGELAGIGYASLPGPVGVLRQRAGADQILSAQEALYLNLSSFTTAMWAELRAAVAPVVIDSPAVFSRAARSWDEATLKGLAVLVESVAAGTRPLPAGIANTIEMVRTPAAAFAAVDALFPSGVYDPALGLEIVLDAAETSNWSLPFDTELALSSTDNRQGYGAWVATLGNDGQAQVATNSGTNTEATWTRAGSRYRLVAGEDSPFVTFSRTSSADVPDLGHISVIEHWELIEYGLISIEGPGAEPMLVFDAIYRVSIPAHPSVPPWLDPTPQLGPFPSLIGRQSPLAAWSPAGQLWLLPLQRGPAYYGEGDGQYDNGYYDVHRFEGDGSGLTTRESLAFTWQVSGQGNLEVAYADGWRAELIKTAEHRGQDVVIAHSQGPDELSYANGGAAMMTTSALPLEQEVSGRYARVNDLRAYAGILGSAAARARIDVLYALEPGGIGTRAPYDLLWSIEAERLRLDILNLPNGHTFLPWIERLAWQWLSDDGEFIYVLENRAPRSTEVLPPASLSGRTGRIQRLRRLPP
jgi:hypothetical protein